MSWRDGIWISLCFNQVHLTLLSDPSEMATWSLLHTMVLPREGHCRAVLLQ